MSFFWVGHFEFFFRKKKIFFCFIPMKISPNLYGRMDGSKFWRFPWFLENSWLCVIQCIFYSIFWLVWLQISNVSSIYTQFRSSKDYLVHFHLQHGPFLSNILMIDNILIHLFLLDFDSSDKCFRFLAVQFPSKTFILRITQ